MAVTIRQIAAAAGVSRGTVDRVLHNRPGVNHEAAAHVRRIASELGYQPNRAGKVLAARKQPIKIGCFLPGIGNAFFDDVVAGIRNAESELSDFGVSVELLEREGYEARTHIDAIQSLMARGCGALCVSTVDTPEIRECVNRIIDSGKPVITVNTDLTGTGRLCYVGCDYVQAGQTAAGLLSLMSVEKINLLIVTGSLNMKGHNDRISGFSKTLREKAVTYALVDVFESFDNNEHAYNSTIGILRGHPEINCVYIAAAGVEGVCRAIVELGRQHDIYVLSHDEVASTRKLVTDGVISFTIGQEPWQQGYKAVHLMFNYFMSDKKNMPGNYITGTIIKIKENLYRHVL